MRREERPIVALLAFLHGAVHANVLAIPVFLLAWRAEFRADDVTLGLLAAIAYGGYGLSSVPFGFLADRRSPQRLLVVCGLGASASLAGIAASPSVVALAVALGALGLCSGIYHPTGLAALSRSVGEAGRAMGWHGMGGSAGIASGPAIVGLVLALGGSWRVAAGMLIGPPLVAAALLLAQPRLLAGTGSPAAPAASLRGLFTVPYVRVLLVYMFAGFAYQGGLTFLPGFLGAAPFTIALGLGAISQVLAGTLADRPRPDRILFVLSLVAAALLVALGLSPPSAAFTAVAIAFGFVLFSLEPLQNTLVAGQAPRSVRGLAFGFSFLSVFGLGSLGAVLAGWMVTENAAGLFALLGTCLAISGSLALGVRPGPSS